MPTSVTPIARPSLTEPLLERYKAAPSIANVGGGSAKDCGTSGADVMFPGDQSIQTGFVERQPIQVTEFTAASLNYAKTLGVDTTKYKG